jgi:hypothetical protein
VALWSTAATDEFFLSLEGYSIVVLSAALIIGIHDFGGFKHSAS